MLRLIIWKITKMVELEFDKIKSNLKKILLSNLISNCKIKKTLIINKFNNLLKKIK